MRAVKDRDRFGPRCSLDVRIGTREMTEQRPIRFAIPGPDERDVRYVRLARGGCDERRERMIVHETPNRDAISGAEMAGNVKAHGALATINAGWVPVVPGVGWTLHRGS